MPLRDDTRRPIFQEEIISVVAQVQFEVPQRAIIEGFEAGRLERQEIALLLKICRGRSGAQGRSRTTDTTIFNRLLYH